MTPVWLAATLTIQAGMLGQARASLVEGDTANAVAVLLTARADTGMGPADAAAFALLQWIGRSQEQSAARTHFVSASRRLRNAVARRDAAIVLVYAGLVDGGARERDFRRAFGGVTNTDYLTLLARQAAERDPLLAGAAAWVLMQAELRRFGREFPRVIPSLPAFPPECRRGTARIESCTLRQHPPPEYRPAALIGASDSLAQRLARVRDLAARTAAAPWPYDELGTRALLALALILDTAPPDVPTGRFHERAESELRVLVGEFAGDRDAAAAEMLAHPEWFAELDDDLSALGEVALPAPVFWRVAWPLFLEPYNARSAAHRARVLLADLLSRLVPADDQPFWLYGSRRLVIRRGIPLAMVRVARTARGSGGRDVVVEYLPPHTHETLVRPGDPERNIALDLALASRDDYASVRAVTGFVASHYDRLRPFRHQVVQYVRDGQRHVDIYGQRSYALDCSGGAPVVGLFLLDGQLGLLRTAIDTVASSTRRHRFRLVLEPGAYVYSLELLDRVCHHAARSRYVLTVPQPARQGLSDLVLADALRVDEIRRLVRAQPMTARPDLSVPAGAPAHFYWEVYGIPGHGDEVRYLEVSFEVTAAGRGRVGVRRLGEVARAARDAAPALAVEYRVAVPPGDAPLVMGLTVELPGEAWGVHVARLRVVDAASREAFTASRAFHVDLAVR